MDYLKIGLKVGLEIHQQLNTHKLFCKCKSELTDEVTGEIIQSIRQTQSESSGVDVAALTETFFLETLGFETFTGSESSISHLGPASLLFLLDVHQSI